jgi:molybdopterin-guanine dinucleotide biosynthesis protein A
VRRAGVVLAGGRSERMGADKASLLWRGEPLVLHTLRAVQGGLVSPSNDQLQGPVVVVRAVGQELPLMPDGVEVVDDTEPGRGPLQGLRDALAALAGRTDVAFVAATDLPLLRPELVSLVLDAVQDDVDAAVPVVEGRRHPLAAAYRTSLLGFFDDLLAADERRLGAVLEQCRVRELDEETLRLADPELASFVNVNAPEDIARL